jgi:uncharacterized protein YjiS (DUF1127 family)
MHTISRRPDFPTELTALGRRWTPRRMVLRTLGALLLWQERARQRANLAALDDHLLKDMGLSRAAAAFEASKPFWRA